MSITLIAMTGILVGFLCLVIGFFMEDSKDRDMVQDVKRKTAKKKIVVQHKKAA